MRWIVTFFSACIGLFVLACGALWALGVFSGVGTGAVVGTILGILFATVIGTALMALAIHSDQSGHDDVIARVKDTAS